MTDEQRIEEIREPFWFVFASQDDSPDISFVEVENEHGASVRVGSWEFGYKGEYSRIGPFYRAGLLEQLEAQERKWAIDREFRVVAARAQQVRITELETALRPFVRDGVNGMGECRHCAQTGNFMTHAEGCIWMKAHASLGDQEGVR